MSNRYSSIHVFKKTKGEFDRRKDQIEEYLNRTVSQSEFVDILLENYVDFRTD